MTFHVMLFLIISLSVVQSYTQCICSKKDYGSPLLPYFIHLDRGACLLETVLELIYTDFLEYKLQKFVLLTFNTKVNITALRSFLIQAREELFFWLSFASLPSNSCFFGIFHSNHTGSYPLSIQLAKQKADETIKHFCCFLPLPFFPTMCRLPQTVLAVSKMLRCILRNAVFKYHLGWQHTMLKY